MKRCAFSIAIVVTLAVFSVVAFASSFVFGIPADIVSAIGTGNKAAFVIETRNIDMPERDVLEVDLVKKTVEVSSQSVIDALDLKQEDLYLLAKIAMAEAEEEDTEGKALVMLVVLNRIADNEFPDTVEKVIYQPGQFTPVSDGRFDVVEPDADCWKALDLVMTEKWDASCGATYFESESESTWHRENLDFLFEHGRLYFYIDGEGDDV